MKKETMSAVKIAAIAIVLLVAIVAGIKLMGGGSGSSHRHGGGEAHSH